MSEKFDLPVWFNNEEIMFPAEFQPWGYSHRIIVSINQYPFIFEPDEEKKYRAIISADEMKKAGNTDKQLLQAITETLQDLFGD